MNSEMEKALAISQVESLLMLAAERNISIPALITKESLKSMESPDLERIRRNLHELVYAPPVNNR